MELKDFVADTLTQISEGILKAQEQAGSKGLYICPRMTAEGRVAKEGEFSHVAHKISFDIAVEAVASRGADGKGEIEFHVKVFSLLNIGVDSSTKEVDSAINKQASRIQFDIPVVWPTVAPKDPSDPVFERHEIKEYKPF